MPEAFGQLSFCVALVSLAAPMMALGLNSLVSREVLLRPLESDLIVGSALLLRVLSGLLVAAAGSALAYSMLPEKEALLLAILLSSNICNASLVFDFWFQAHVANGYAVFLRLGVFFLFSVLRLVAVSMEVNLNGFVYLLAGEVCFLSIGYALVYHNVCGGLSSFKVSAQECRSLLQRSGWLLFSGIAAVIYLKVDQVMLGILVDDHAVGIYAVAAKFSEVWYFLPAILVTSYFPQLIDMRVNDPKEYARHLQKINDCLFVLALTVALLVTFFAGRVIPLIFGENYADSTPVLVVHIWAAILVFMRALLSKWLITENLLRLSLLSQLSGAFVNVGLNTYLIPRLGPLGAAYATVVSYLVSGYLVLFMHPDLRPMAIVVSRSLLLPFRLLRHGRQLYRDHPD